MKFRTEIEIESWHRQIEYKESIVSLGSCFADNIARKLAERKFSITASPTGILFNPASISSTLNQLRNGYRVSSEELILRDGRYLNYDFHSSFSASTAEEAIAVMQNAMERGAEAMKRADHIIITLGTAWVYRLKESGKVVANCHKQQQALFDRQMLTVKEIVDSLAPEIEHLAPQKQVILTLSPVRHIGDGLVDNSLSKATLRVAIEELCRRYSGVIYFPAYEIVMDDLRDYRFYADDLTHPSTSAIEYIAERFFDVALSTDTKQRMMSIERIVRAAQHRPMNPHSEEYRAFCRKQLDEIAKFEDIDFEEEKRHFGAMLQINL